MVISFFAKIDLLVNSSFLSYKFLANFAKIFLKKMLVTADFIGTAAFLPDIQKSD
ncbi:hypothetical protein STRDD11_02384 [Streptococcus sp. DD11]|nr:hypothetical protein STRDD11_02384 [Streptococcus sp. DD11]